MMHTTTVRFDPEVWTFLKVVADELGVAVADFIRIATVQRLERYRYEGNLRGFERRLQDVERVIDWLLTRLRVRPPSRRRRAWATVSRLTLESSSLQTIGAVARSWRWDFAHPSIFGSEVSCLRAA